MNATGDTQLPGVAKVTRKTVLDGFGSISVAGIDIAENLKYKTLRFFKAYPDLYALGQVTDQQESDAGGVKAVSLSCSDNAFYLKKRVVAERFGSEDSYQGRPDLILKYLISRYVPELTTNAVQSCSEVIDELYLEYIYMSEVMNRIMKHLADWHWYVDGGNDLHFFKGYESEGAKFGKVGEYFNFQINSLNVSYKGEEGANRIWIVGAKQASPDYIDQYFTSDGVQRVFPLAYLPNYSEITMDGGDPMNWKLLKNDDGAQDFLIDKEGKVLSIPANVNPIPTGQIRIHYRPTVQVVDYFEDPKSIRAHGLLEAVVKSKDITDRLSARKVGKAMLKRQARSKRVVSLRTLEERKIGQRCELDILTDKWDVRGFFLVTDVTEESVPGHTVYSIGLEEL